MTRRSIALEGIAAILFVALCLALYAMVTGDGAVKANDWDTLDNGPYSGLQIGEDGMLYAFTGATGNAVYAIDSGGRVAWSLRIPGKWRVENSFNRPGITPVFSTANGTLYLYLRENRTTPWSYYPSESSSVAREATGAAPLKENLIAISRNGDILWNRPIGSDGDAYHDVSVKAKNGRVYVFDDYNVTILDGRGKALFRIGNVSDPPAIDDDGNIYAVSSVMPAGEAGQPWPAAVGEYRLPSSTLRAYYPNGTLYWQENISAPPCRQSICEGLRPRFGTLPIYQNDTLYVPVQHGIISLDANGSMRWQKVYDWSTDCQLLGSMPMDSQGNVYLERSQFHSNSSIEVIDAKGSEIVNRSLNFPLEDYYFVAGGSMYDDRLYYVAIALNGSSTGYPFSIWSSNSPCESYISLDASSLGRLAIDNTTLGRSDVRLNAFSVLNDTAMWNSTIPILSTKTVTLDGDSIKFLPPVFAWWIDHGSAPGSSPPEPSNTGLYMAANILPGPDLIYVSLYSSLYDDPVIYSKSNCTYSSGLYAFSKNGTLVWEKPADYFVTAMAADNGTVYYNTADGRFNVATVAGAAAGGASVLALAYVAVRFFLLGIATRAKDRLNKNGNRKSVQSYIADNPGSTIREISRGLGMNLGTARYHVFILGLHHRIIDYMADDKHVRYFTNSNTYSKEEQFIIAMMKREGMRKILELLVEKPGLTCSDLSGELRIYESAICRYTKELYEKGVIEGIDSGNTSAYFVRDEYAHAITKVAGMLAEK